MHAMWRRLDESAQRAVLEAQKVAARHGLKAVHPECLLAALLREEPLARALLDRWGVTLEDVERLLPPPASQEERAQDLAAPHRPAHVSLPYDPDAKRAIASANQAARELGDRLVGAPHLLLGLIALGRGPACELLQARGVTREGLLAALAEARPEAGAHPASREHVISVRLDEDSLRKIDALVQADVFKSRSEAAYFLIRKGLLAQASLIDQVMAKLAAIRQIQDELKQLFQDQEGR